MLDYSFTKSPEWREKRLIDWEVLRGQLAEEFSRKQIEVEEKYFLNGEETEYKGFKIWAGALIYRCPKIDREAWSYFLKERFPPTYNEPANFAQLNHWQGFVDSILDFGLPVGWSKNHFLDLFDFVFGKEFSPVIESQFPIGKNKVIGRALINPKDLLLKILRAYSLWLRKEDSAPFLWISNLAYVKGVLDSLGGIPVQEALNAIHDSVSENDLTNEVYFITNLIRMHKEVMPISGTAEDVENKKYELNSFLNLFEQTEPYSGSFDELCALVE